MNEEREEVYQILELGKHLKNLHHKKGFGGLLFIDLSMIKFSKLSSYIRQLDKENQELKEELEESKDNYNCLLNQKKQFEYIMSKQVDYQGQQKEFTKWLEEENKQLKDNWKKLKEYIDKTKIKEFEKSYGKRYGKTFNQAEIIVCNMILNKMQKLEEK